MGSCSLGARARQEVTAAWAFVADCPERSADLQYEAPPAMTWYANTFPEVIMDQGSRTNTILAALEAPLGHLSREGSSATQSNRDDCGANVNL